MLQLLDRRNAWLVHHLEYSAHHLVYKKNKNVEIMTKFSDKKLIIHYLRVQNDLRIVNTYSTTNMWVRLKAEDYYNFIAGYFGNVVG